MIKHPELIFFLQLQGWARKAVQCGFHLVPSPIDPFNRRIDYHNPLSCPRTIPVQVEDLVDTPGVHLFQKFARRTRNKRLYLFQEAILKK